MKKITLIILMIPTILFGQKYSTLKIGEKLPMKNHSMINIDNNNNSLKELVKDNGILIIFSCNSCPFVVMWEDRYKELEDKCSKNNIGMAYINSNHAKRNGDDSFKEMKEHSKKMNYNYPYLLDEKSIIANAFGAKTTPHIFLFNNNLELVYSGAIDDNYKSIKKVKEKYLINAIDQLINNKEIVIKNTKAIGCSIKRK